jgi:hypothetical protein
MRWEGAEDVDLVIVFTLNHGIAVASTLNRNAIGSTEAGGCRCNTASNFSCPASKKERRR